MKLTFRPATQQDSLSLAQLYTSTHDIRTCNPNSHAAENASVTKMEELLTSTARLPNYHVYLAFLDDRPIGAFSLLYVPTIMHRELRKFAILDSVLLNPAYRAQAIHQQIVQKALQLSIDAGCDKVTLSASLKRDSDRALYESLGFQQTGWSVSLKL